MATPELHKNSNHAKRPALQPLDPLAHELLALRLGMQPCTQAAERVVQHHLEGWAQRLRGLPDNLAQEALNRNLLYAIADPKLLHAHKQWQEEEQAQNEAAPVAYSG